LDKQAVTKEEQTPRFIDHVAGLLDEVVRLPGILFVMGKGPSAVMEGWVQPKETHVFLKEDWIAVETESWHCHLHLPKVAEIRFVEEPDPHHPDRQAFSVRFLGQGGEPQLMVFCGGMYKRDGLLIVERVNHFRALREKYGETNRDDRERVTSGRGETKAK
jgi:hypothetical protein